MTEQILKELTELETDTHFITKNMKELSQKYPKKFVAIKNKQLIAEGHNFEEVIREIKQKNIDPASVLIEYIPAPNEIIFY